MGKPQRSIRLDEETRKRFGKEIIRLTLNPVILALSDRVIDWGQISGTGKLKPVKLVSMARERFPHLPLSWAVEGAIVLLLAGQVSSTEAQAPKPLSSLPLSYRRFARLSPSEKIRQGSRWKSQLDALRRAK